jgi:hypothetical protein
MRTHDLGRSYESTTSPDSVSWTARRLAFIIGFFSGSRFPSARCRSMTSASFSTVDSWKRLRGGSSTAKRFAHSGHELHGSQRVAADLEELVADADGPHVQELFPERAQLLLDLAAQDLGTNPSLSRG